MIEHIEPPTILSVAVPTPLPFALDYILPSSQEWEWPLGARLTVPLGRREVTGVLLEIKRTASVRPSLLKKALYCYDKESLWSEGLLGVCQWAAAYYHCPIGMVFSEILPATLKKGLPTAPEYMIYYRVTELGQAAHVAQSTRGLKQRALLARCEALEDGLSEIEVSGQSAVVKGLLEKGYIEAHHRTPIPWQWAGRSAELILSDEQQVALDAIEARLEGFAPFLLYGITGSGKTEVYFRAMDQVLQSGKQVLFLVPEIALTPQTLSRLEQAFSVPVVAYHSGLTEKRRLESWRAAKAGDAAIIVGTRSAVFLPLKNPGMIVVDEEHDVSYKQESGFRYNARDCAVKRAHGESLLIILGSATPSLRSLYNADQGRYTLLSLTKPAVALALPKRTYLSLKSEAYQSGISDQLKEKLQPYLDQSKQVMLFLNRRGFAPMMICPLCQYTLKCVQCEANLTYHKQRQLLMCHHCGKRQKITPACQSCKRADMLPYGLGTEQLEKTAMALFPSQRIVRIDRDTVTTHKELKNQLTAIAKGEVDIIIGTQMLAKGHHFPHLSAVVVVNADQGFLSVDCRAVEQTAQLLVQVAGRAGREDSPGEVIFQTLGAKNDALNTLMESGYLSFARQMIADNQEAGLPPVTSSALIAAESKTESEALRYLQHIRRQPEFSKWDWMGPMPAILSKRANWYRYHLLLTAPTPQKCQSQLNALTGYIQDFKNSRIRCFIDVDPYRLG